MSIHLSYVVSIHLTRLSLVPKIYVLKAYSGNDRVLHRNSTVVRRVTNATSEHYGDP